MQLTKFRHACFQLAKDGQSLVVDPGNLSPDLIISDDVIAVVMTHQHPDHFDPANLQKLITKNPTLQIIGPRDVCDQINHANVRVVSAGDHVTVGSFRLEFFGGEHVSIHDSLPPLANLGVMINDVLYYPGDSLTSPNQPVHTLALPVAAPWCKISEVIDFFNAVAPEQAFPTHDGILSADGQAIVDRVIQTVCADTPYRRSKTMTLPG